MSWHSSYAMGSNAGNGAAMGGGNEMNNQMQQPQQQQQPNMSNQPAATEYTLQGVMRFLQIEWHKHERDRNAWEIVEQEMKARIATLEGQAKRSDATQKALKKYVTILETKVKDQSAQIKNTGTAGSSSKADTDGPVKQPDRDAMLRQTLRASIKPTRDSDAAPVEDETQRNELRTFLDSCQAEFTYLMVTPANPPPPRESPPMNNMDEGEPYGIPGASEPMGQVFSNQMRGPMQSHGRDPMMQQQHSSAPPPAHNRPPPQRQHHQAAPPGVSEFAVKGLDQAPPMVRSSNANVNVNPSQLQQFTSWTSERGSLPVTARLAEQAHEIERASNSGTPFPQPPPPQEEDKQAADSDGWVFESSTFSEPISSGRPQSARPDQDVFPAAENLPKSPNRTPHRRKSASSRRHSGNELSLSSLVHKVDTVGNFRLRFGLRGHLETVRTVIFSGGGSPSEPEICTSGDDGMIKRFHLPRFDSYANHPNAASDLDVMADFTHRGHEGPVLSIAAWSPSPNFSTGGRAQGDGWIFSGGKDATIRVWERGRVDPKATLYGHTDAVWALCVLPATLGGIFGVVNSHGAPDRILLVSGAADGTVRLWAASCPPQLTSPQPPPAGRGVRGPGSGRVRNNSMSSGSGFPSSPQPSIASNSQFNYTLVHTIERSDGSKASPTCITPLSSNGETFVVSYSDAAIFVYDTRTAEQIGSMASLETYNGTIDTSVNAIVATTVSLDQHSGSGAFPSEEGDSAGPTGGGRSTTGSGVEGVIISGHEDRFIRFFDANIGQCTYNMLAHPAAISSLSLSPDGRELVSAGHDASLRFWSLEKRSCTQEITSHRIMRGEGVCSVVWSKDGRWVVSGGGDGIVKVFAR